MRNILRALAFVAALLPGIAGAQSLSNMPPNTVAGRLGISSGPWQAVPFSVLVSQLLGGPIQTANTVYAGPAAGASAAPTFRALVGADLPAPGASSFGGVLSSTCSSHTWFNTLSTAGSFGCSQPSFSDLSGSLACSQTPALTGDVASTAGSCGTTIQANAVSNSKMATMNAWTIKMNNTSGAAAPTDTTIDGLTLKASPATNDEIPIWDVTGTAMKKATIASVISSGSQSPVLLNTLTASSSATLGDTTSLTATYTSYEIILENLIPATAAVSCEIQVQSGGSFQTTGYITSGYAPNGTAIVSTTPTTFIPCSGSATQTNSVGISGSFRIVTPSTTAVHTLVGLVNEVASGPSVAPFTFSGMWNSSAVVTGFQVLFSSGNITSGVIKVYGVP